MKNNVYVRTNRSYKTISITRILFIIPMIIYGIYKNGIFLYREGLISLYMMLKPIMIILGSALIGAIVNIIYEYLIKKNKDNLIDVLFSSFTIEYGILLACIMSINVNIYIYFIITFIVLFITRFINNRVNAICIAFLLIYVCNYYLEGFSFANIYESTKDFAYGFMDYMVGRAPGGIASTHILFLILALFGLFLTNSNKSLISLTSMVSYLCIVAIFTLIKGGDIAGILFSNNYLFIASLIATDSVTSCYTHNGMIIYGILIAILSFIIYFVNPVIAPVVAVLIISLFNNLIDRKSNNYASNNSLKS